jgi:cupin 2 domain-containing protein
MSFSGFEVTGNIYDLIPEKLENEVFGEIIRTGTVRIERILSQGQAAPESGWYDQDENEWVMILQGHARLVFADGEESDLAAGDYLNIPAHRKHRVVWTDPDRVTVWLAVFYP